jgi:hypothetical protein
MTEEIKKNKPKKSASLDDILNAVAQKENVVKPFAGKKVFSVNKKVTWQQFVISFVQGLLFGVGFMLIVCFGLFILLKLHQLHRATLIFYKLVYLFKALGR